MISSVEQKLTDLEYSLYRLSRCTDYKKLTITIKDTGDSTHNDYPGQWQLKLNVVLQEAAKIFVMEADDSNNISHEVCLHKLP